jgi:large conductance mechanosensitive channel
MILPPGVDGERGGTMLKEFRDFLLRGNIVELAVAFVIGTAFAVVVASLVDNLLMPFVAMIIGEPDFRDLTFTINDAVFRYGAFLTDAITFVAVAAAVFFFVVKPIGALLARRAATVEEGLPDEERRHRELLAALEALRR